MPNIFICGYGTAEADYVKHIIDGAMKLIGLQDEAITSIVEMRPESCDYKKTSKPYLWIRSTKKKEIMAIIIALKAEGIKEDIEWDHIGGFIPAEKM